MRTIWKYHVVVMAVVLAFGLLGCEGCGMKGKRTPPQDTVYTTPPTPPPVEPPPVRPEVPADKVLMEHPDLKTVYFDYDKYDLRPDALAVLRNNLVWLKAEQNLQETVVIEGHCDERGSEQYNQVLGEKRANAVRAWLIANGVSAERLVTISLGESQPADPRSNEEAWARNRRGVFKTWQERPRS